MIYVLFCLFAPVMISIFLMIFLFFMYKKTKYQKGLSEDFRFKGLGRSANEIRIKDLQPGMVAFDKPSDGEDIRRQIKGYFDGKDMYYETRLLAAAALVYARKYREPLRISKEDMDNLGGSSISTDKDGALILEYVDRG